MELKYLSDGMQVVAFMVRYRQTNKFMHHNLVVTLLNDLFGIQCRGGCMCAGPLGWLVVCTMCDDVHVSAGIRLLGLSVEQTIDLENAVLHKQELLRPGFVRVSLGYYWTDEDVDFLVEAVKFVASEGWKIMPAYRLNPYTAEWKHRAAVGTDHMRRIGDISYQGGKMSFPKLQSAVPEPVKRDLLLSFARECAIETAREYAAPSQAEQAKIAETDAIAVPQSVRDQGFCWVAVPSDALQDLDNPQSAGSDDATSSPHDQQATSKYQHFTLLVTPKEPESAIASPSPVLEEHVESVWLSLSFVSPHSCMPDLIGSSVSDHDGHAPH
jgi:hypothetical protein